MHPSRLSRRCSGARNHDRTDSMASTGKRKTTMAKLARESRLRERRVEKEARKQARKDAPAHAWDHPSELPSGVAETDDPDQSVST